MTNEKARDLLAMIEVISPNELRVNSWWGSFAKDYEEALQMAIKALEQQPCDDWYDVPSDEMTLGQARQAVKDLRKKLAEYLDQKPCDNEDVASKSIATAFQFGIAMGFAKKYDEMDRVMEEVKKAVTPEQQPCEDAISRQAAIDIIESWLSCDDYNEAERHIMRAMQSVLYDLPPVTPKQDPCEDAVSRQAAIDSLNKYFARIGKLKGRGLNKGEKAISLDTIGVIETLPLVTPKEKTGKWIDDGQYAEGHNEHAYRCSKCDETYIGYAGKYKYCPNCGIKMEEVGE